MMGIWTPSQARGDARNGLVGFDGVTGCYGSPFVNEGRTAMSVEKLVEHFSALEDPRCSGKVDHRRIDILVIAVCAVIACAESWDDIALYGRNKLSWLRSFLSLANGIPSHDTFRRVFMLIGPGRLRGLLQRLGSILCRGLRPGGRGH